MELESFNREAMNYGQTPQAIRTAPKSSDHLQSRSADTAQAIDWLVHLRRQFSGGMRSTCSVVCEGDGIVPW